MKVLALIHGEVDPATVQMILGSAGLEVAGVVLVQDDTAARVASELAKSGIVLVPRAEPAPQNALGGPATDIPTVALAPPPGVRAEATDHAKEVLSSAARNPYARRR